MQKINIADIILDIWPKSFYRNAIEVATIGLDASLLASLLSFFAAIGNRS